MSGMSGFGSFMEGLQGGVKSGQGIRRERQLDDIYDSAIRKIGNEERADDAFRKSRGLEEGDKSSLGDPIGQQIWKKFQGWIGGKDASAAVSAIPDPGAAAAKEKAARVDSLTPNDGYAPQYGEQPSYGGGVGPIPYADGGQPRDYVTRDERVPKVRGNTVTGRVVGAAKDAARAGVDKVRAAIPTEIGVDKLGGAEGKTGAARAAARVKGVAKGAGIGYLAGQAISGAKDAYGASTEDMAGEMGINYAPPDGILGAGYDAAIRTGGTLKRVGDAILGRGGEEEIAPAAPAPAEAPSRGIRPGAPPSAVARKPAAATAIPTPGAAPAAPAPPQDAGLTPEVVSKIPWDKVDPMELPKYKTQDWVKYREEAIDQLAMRGGVSMVDAYEKVDQQVIAMQQRGTKALLQEAIMRVQSGDMKGAGNALVQMFQYVPSGTDAVVGTYNGQLVAQFVDEATGQPVGEPTPVNAQMLGDLWQQYANPAAWAEMAQDRRKTADTERRTGLLERGVDLQERRLDEVEIPEAQSNAEYRATVGQASMAKAVGGGEGGLKPNEGLASDKDVRDVIAQYAMQADEDGEPLDPRLQDPNIQRALLTAIMKKKRQDPSRPTEDILTEILSLAEE